MCALTEADRATIIEVLRTHASCVENATPLPDPRFGPEYGPAYAAHLETGIEAENIARRLLQPCECCGH